MKKLTYIAGLLPFLFAACEDVNDKIDGLDEIVENNKLVVDNSLKYTLTDDDYVTIGKYTAIDDADEDELALLQKGSVKSFSSAEFARKYLTQFIANKWYQVDKGSSIKLTYNLATEEDATYASVLSASSLTLSAADYTSAGSTTGYLTPSTVSKLPSVIASNVSSAKEGDYCVVSYQYSNTEPSSSDDDQQTESHWTALDIDNLPAGTSWAYNRVNSTIADTYAGQKIRLAFRYTSTTATAGTIEVANLSVDNGSYVYPTLFVLGANGASVSSTNVAAGDILLLSKVGDAFYALDKINDTNSKGYGYSKMAEVPVTDGVVSSEDFEANKLTIESVDGGFTIKNTDGNYLWHQGTYNSFQYSSALPDDLTGYVWTFTKVGATVTIANVSTGYIIALGSSYKTYGVYADSKLSSNSYFENSLLGSSLPDGFSIVDVTLPSALTYVWSATTNYGLKASSYKNGNLESESWVISPEIDLSSVTSSASLSIDVVANKFYDATVSDYFQVLVSTDYVEGTDLVVDGTKSLKAAAASETIYAIYYYNGSKWEEASDAIVVSPSDYTTMGLSNTNFSKTYAADTYLPKFLDLKFPYASADDAIYVAYHYYDGSATSLCADKYVYTSGAWSKVSPNATTEPFAYSASGWVYDPSVTITLPYVKNNATSVAFYQAVVDWVWENIDKELGSSKKGDAIGYTSSYGNNEYYTGCSAYYCNVDWRPAKAVAQYAAGFEGLDDDQVIAKMQENFINVVGKVLGVLYPDAKAIDGVDVIYTINFTAYFDGPTTKVYTIQYKVVDKATFEYVEDSLQPTE